MGAILLPGQLVRVNLAGLDAGGVTFQAAVTDAVAHILKQTSEPPKYLVEPLFSFRGVSQVEVPADFGSNLEWVDKRERVQQAGGPLVENTILVQGLHPALKKVGLPKSGMHAFRRGCNRRWELARVSSAVIRQQMGHATASMTALYTGEIPVEQVAKQFQLEPNGAAIAA